MTREECLDRAADLISCDRAATHGDAHRNFAAIAMAWDALDMARGNRPRSGLDVALYMQALKAVRAAGNPGHQDSWHDGIGYGALGGELAAAMGAGFPAGQIPPHPVAASGGDAAPDHPEPVSPVPETAATVSDGAGDGPAPPAEPAAALEGAADSSPAPGHAASMPPAEWTREESLALLRGVIGERRTVRDVAADLGRTANACSYRLRVLRGTIDERSQPIWARAYLDQLRGPAEKPGTRDPEPAKVQRPAEVASSAETGGWTALTLPQRRLVQHLERLDDGFAPADDLALAEGLGRGVPHDKLCDSLGMTYDCMIARWKRLVPASIRGPSGLVTIDGQADLLAALRYRAQASR